MARGSKRLRGKSWELRAYAGKGRQITRTLPPVDGKPLTKTAAERHLTAFLREVDEGKHATSGSVTELLERWRAHAGGDWSPSTSAAYAIYIDRHIIPQLGRRQVRNLTAADLDHHYSQLLTKIDCTFKRARTSGECATCGRSERAAVHHGLAPASIAKVHTILRRALTQAVRWGWIPTNPALNARPPRVPRSDLHPPEPADVRLLLELAAETDLGVYIHLAAATGARRGELCALRWADVDLDRGELLIARSLVQGTRTLAEKGTKTHQSRRIALDAATVRILTAHRTATAEQALACGAPYPDTAHLFSTDPDGETPWRPDGATSRFATLRAKAGLDHVRLHDLRHYVATRLLAAGVDVRTVAGRLGHANAATTLNVYAAFVPAADRAAAELLAGELNEISAQPQGR